MNTFFIRPGYKSDINLIEFSGDHRADDYPPVFNILKKALDPTRVTMEDSVTDDDVWQIEFKGGIFELNDDWGGLFVLPKTNAKQVIAQVSNALVSSGYFEEVQVDISKYT